MDFARQQRDPKRHLIGITTVVLLHVLVIWGLMNGLGKKVVEVIKKPVTATIVEEIKKPPPPPPPPPPKKIEPPKAPPPIQLPFIPPPDVPPPIKPIETPIIAAAPEPPKEPYVIAPPAPAVVEAPPAPPAPAPKPAVRRNVSRLSGDDPVYPREAIKAGIAKGRVVARLKVDEKGNVADVEITAASPPRVFDRAVREALSGWKLPADGEKYTAEVELNFSLKDD